MNKKGIIIVVVIIILIIAGYVVWGGKGSSSVSNSNGAVGGAVVDDTTPAPTTDNTKALDATTKDTTDTSLLGRLKSASVSAAETGSRVALVNGKAQFSAEGASGSIALGDVAVEKTFGGKKYVAAPLAVTTGGATYQYVALFTDDGTLTDQSYDLVGTNVTVTGLRMDEVSGGLVVTAAFKDAGGKAHTKILVVENGVFNPSKDISF